MQHKERCTIADLQPGDRFCFASDKKRESQQLIKRLWKKALYIDAAIVDRGHTEELLIKWSTETKYNREVIFLRHTKDVENQSTKQ